MAENSSTNSNSWTILAPEVQSGVESMGPLSENQEEVQAEPALTQSSALSDTLTEQTRPPESPQVTPLESSTDAVTFASTPMNGDTECSIPAHVETIPFSTSHSEEHGFSGNDSESQHLIDTESFSDSYTHIRPLPLSTSLPGTLEKEEEDQEVLSPGEVKEHKWDDKANEDDGLRKRNISVLTPLSHQDEEEEEEEDAEEEQFRHPHREGVDDTGFTLNKCIFGALILLGLGTIFFSGVFMDLDDERDVNAKDLKYTETKKDWLDPDAQPGDIQPPQILDKLAKENQAAGLQAHLQKLDLKKEKLQVDEVTKERLLREELEAENQRMRGELDKLPVLQKEVEQESERVKRESERLNKELKALPALQKELEHLKDKVMELTQRTVSMQVGTPSAGQDDVPGHQKSKTRHKERDLGMEHKEWKNEKKTKMNDKHDKEKRSKERKEWKNEKDLEESWKKEEKNRQNQPKEEDDDKRWKLDGEKREFKEKNRKRDNKGAKKWEKEKHEDFVDGKGKENKEWKHKSEQKDWNKDDKWKRDTQASQKSKEEKSEKKNRKDRNKWNSEKERGGSDEEKYSERIQREKPRKGKKEDHDAYSGPKESWKKHRSGKEKENSKSGQKPEEWRDEKRHKDKNHNKADKMNWKGKHEASPHSHSDRKHGNDHVHINYWDKQRVKIRHYYGSTEGCADVTACAHAEGLAPVSQQDFQAFISDYLTKLQEHGDQTSKKEKLNKLLSEFFTDGVFVHDQIPFSEFVEDVEDILEDLTDNKNDDDELENEMNGFAMKAMEMFVHQKKEGNKEIKGESGRKKKKG